MAQPTPSGPGRAPQGAGGVPPRRIGTAVWGAMVGMLLLFLAVVLAVEQAPRPEAPRELLFWLAAATSALGIALSRLLPQRIPARQAGGRPAANAMTRLIIGWALCQGVAIFPLVAHMLVRDQRLLLVFAVDVAALLLLYPSADLWARFSAQEAHPAGRMVR